jgi:hypothetical protein
MGLARTDGGVRVRGMVGYGGGPTAGPPPAEPAGQRPALDTFVKTISTTWRTIA